MLYLTFTSIVFAAFWATPLLAAPININLQLTPNLSDWEARGNSVPRGLRGPPLNVDSESSFAALSNPGVENPLIDYHLAVVYAALEHGGLDPQTRSQGTKTVAAWLKHQENVATDTSKTSKVRGIAKANIASYKKAFPEISQSVSRPAAVTVTDPSSVSHSVSVNSGTTSVTSEGSDTSTTLEGPKPISVGKALAVGGAVVGSLAGAVAGTYELVDKYDPNP